MEALSQNEIITLRHLSDGNNAEETPKGLTDAQYYTALVCLKGKGMVRAAFCEGESVYAAEILKLGQAMLDDIEAHPSTSQEIYNSIDDDDIRILYFLSDGEEHFDRPEGIQMYRSICKDLANKGYVKIPRTKDNGYMITSEGKQFLDQYLEKIQGASVDNGMVNAENVKDGGFRISSHRLTDFIKLVWTMHDIGMFEDQNGNKPTTKCVMDAFGEFLKAKQLKQYTVYLNKALQAKENTFLEVFDQMEKSAEKFHKEKNERMRK